MASEVKYERTLDCPSCKDPLDLVFACVGFPTHRWCPACGTRTMEIDKRGKTEVTIFNPTPLQTGE